MKSLGGASYVTAFEMKEIDAAAVEEYGLDVLELMENAGVAVATVAKEILGGEPKGKRVVCLAGKGNNGGDGLVAARHLSNWGAEVSVILAARPDELEGVPAKQFSTAQKSGTRILPVDSELGNCDLLLDALLGYSATGNPREPVASLIKKADASEAPVLAVDLPSGLDPTTGEPNDPCIVARATVTFALPKTGFLNPKSKKFTGMLYLADISIPRALYQRYGAVHPFGRESILKLV